jgi:translation initiation factor 1
MTKNSGGLVYSTEVGRTCSFCEKAIDSCICEDALPEGDGIARIRPEKKGRGGKVVTTISGLMLDKKELAALAKQLKKRCGTGGSVKNHVIEIQGDVCEIIQQELTKKGITNKRSGG